MHSKTPEEKIQAIAQRIIKQFNPEKIVLFGSYARGTAGADSDADFLVIMPVAGSLRAKRIELRLAIHGLGIAKDLILLRPEEFEAARQIPGTLARAADREGKTLYERAA